jgi:RNA recognition motif-containing protein
MSSLSNRQETSVKNIFVGNLDFNSSEESVRSLFERYGTVNSARIMTDRDTGRSRGFAFVEMENEAEADQAITALNGYTLDSRALNVNEARPKPDRGFGGGGGGGRGFGGGGGRPGGGGGRPGGGRREPRW